MKGEKDKVVSIKDGAPVYASGEVQPEVLDLVERVLAQVMAGQVVGAAIVLLHRDGECTHVYDGDVALGVVGALERLKQKILLNEYGEE